MPNNNLFTKLLRFFILLFLLVIIFKILSFVFVLAVFFLIGYAIYSLFKTVFGGLKNGIDSITSNPNQPKIEIIPPPKKI